MDAVTQPFQIQREPLMTVTQELVKCILPALRGAGVKVVSLSWYDHGLLVEADGELIGIELHPLDQEPEETPPSQQAPNRYSVEKLGQIASAADEYERRTQL